MVSLYKWKFTPYQSPYLLWIDMEKNEIKFKNGKIKDLYSGYEIGGKFYRYFSLREIRWFDIISIVEAFDKFKYIELNSDLHKKYPNLYIAEG